MPSLITAGGLTVGAQIVSATDGAITIQSGPDGSKVNALAIDSSGNANFAAGISKGGVATRQLVQIQTVTSSSFATGTTIIPMDDTIPQQTEGDQYMSLAITPTNASSTLEIDVTIELAHSAIVWMIAALFQDSTANALAAMTNYNSTTGGAVCITFKHIMTAGTTSSTTFKVRGGGHSAGTTTFNGLSGGRGLGGVMASRITIKEYLP